MGSEIGCLMGYSDQSGQQQTVVLHLMTWINIYGKIDASQSVRRLGPAIVPARSPETIRGIVTVPGEVNPKSGVRRSCFTDRRPQYITSSSLSLSPNPSSPSIEPVFQQHNLSAYRTPISPISPLFLQLIESRLVVYRFDSRNLGCLWNL